MLSNSLEHFRGGTDKSVLYSFADVASYEKRSKIGSSIIGQIKTLSKPDATRKEAQRAVDSITRKLLPATFEPTPAAEVLLLPILRAGIAMWSASNTYFDSPESSFLIGSNEKGADQVSVTWPKINEARGRHVVVLEPIIATGNTVVAAYETIMDQSDGLESLTVLCCYAAPLGAQSIVEKTRGVNVVVGCLAETVSPDGYLVPPTNGDMGDKLYGNAKEQLW